MSSAPNELPEGWVEPVNESLLRPASFFGAAPRNLVIFVYAIGGVVLFIGAINKLWTVALAVVGTIVFVQIATASLTYLEPHWFDLLVGWMKSPQKRVDP